MIHSERERESWVGLLLGNWVGLGWVDLGMDMEDGRPCSEEGGVEWSVRS